MRYFLVAIGLICWLCSKSVPATAQASVFGHRAKPNEVTSKGKPVLYYLSGAGDFGGMTKAVVLTKSYGYMIVNEGKDRQPQPLFILASAKNKRVENYTSLSDFRKAVLRLPKETQLYRYDRCTDTASRGLPASIERQIRQVCRQGSIRLPNRDQRFLTCICSP